MKIRKIKNENIFLYSVLAISFIVFIFSVTYTYLQNNLREIGKSYVINNYYDIVMQNAMIDYSTTSRIELNNSDSIIGISINDLKKYNKENTISLELYNIGNIDAVISNIIITNIISSVNQEKISVDLSLKKGDVITSSERKTLKISIKCNDLNISDIDFYNFDIKLSYKELVK